MRITTALASVAAATALIAGTTAPAGAATQTRTDEAGDTFSQGFDGPASEDIQEAADIVTLRGVHGDGTLDFTFTLEDVGSTAGSREIRAAVRLVTPTEADYTAALEVAGGEKSVTLFRAGSDNTVACEGLVGRVLAARDQYVFSVPRSCVRNPREVVFGGTAFYANYDDSADYGVAYDDARRTESFPLQEIRLGTRALKNN